MFDIAESVSNQLMQEELNANGSPQEEAPAQDVDPSSIGGKVIRVEEWKGRPDLTKVYVNRGREAGVEPHMWVDLDGKGIGHVRKAWTSRCKVQAFVPYGSMRLRDVPVTFSNTQPAVPAQAATTPDQDQDWDQALDEPAAEVQTESATDTADREAHEQFKDLVHKLLLAGSTEGHDDDYDFEALKTATEAILTFAERRPGNSFHSGDEASQLQNEFLDLWDHFKKEERRWSEPIQNLETAQEILRDKSSELRHARENH